MDPLGELRWLVDRDLVIRLFAGALLGGCIGLERELRAHPAGLRTHMLVGLAAALFTIVAIDLARRLDAVTGGMGVDPLRAIEAVTAGVAFIAAGAIIRSGDKVRNLTTGAGMWLAGAVGLATGAGYLGLAVLATALAVVILTALRWLEMR
ncbi:MAG: MgtC/SapB family protein [Alphaproteobacteria bacterium]|nr:MgtC/SapB family protein [Alphaproteobacteria bacterium]